MNGQISIEHLAGSSLAGMKQDYSGPTVTLGTSPASHVCFDADDDAAVANKHAKLSIEPDGVHVEALDADAVVLLNDKPIDGKAQVKTGDKLQLGENGPSCTLTVRSLPSGDGPTRTVMGGAAPASTPPATGGGEGKANKPPMPGGLAPTVVGKRPAPTPSPASATPGIPGKPPPVRVDLGVPPAPEEPASTWKSKRKPHGDGGTKPPSDLGQIKSSRPPGAGIGMNTLMGVVDQATKRERGRNTVKLLTLTGVFCFIGLIAIGAAVVFWPEPGGETTNITQVTGDSGPNWKAVAEKVRPSICLAMMRKPGAVGTESGFGTVWSVGEGVFATNAHVAELFNDTETFGEKPEIIIRTPGANPKDLRVKSVVIHPGYDIWQQMISEYNPFLPGEKTFMADKVFGTCDVALMYIQEADYEHQPPPLTLADEEEAVLSVGQDLATFGYPQEGIKLNVRNPESEGRFGVVSKLGDSFLASVERGKSEFVWYNWESAGGASGSPVFNKDGEVVSLLSAGNVIGMVGSARISAGGTSLGPHVRFVKELLNKTASVEQAERNETWRAELLETFVEGTKHSEALADLFAGQFIFGILPQLVPDSFDGDKQDLEVVSRTAGTIQVSGGAGKATINDVRFSTGPHMLFVVSINKPTQIAVYSPQDQNVQPEFAGYFTFDPRPLFRPIQQGFSAPVVVQAAPGSEDGPTQVEVFVYRVVNKPQAQQ